MEAQSPDLSQATVSADAHRVWMDWARQQVEDWADSQKSMPPSPVMVEAADLKAITQALALGHQACCKVIPAMWEVDHEAGQWKFVDADLIGPCEQAYLDLDDLMVTHCRPVCQLHGFYMVPGLESADVFCRHGVVFGTIRPSVGLHVTPGDFQWWVATEGAGRLATECLAWCRSMEQ